MPDGGETDPGEITRLVVHAEDVVTAYETRARSDQRAVLRVTPPFNARMRARIHVAQAGEYEGQDGPRPLHVDPADLLRDECPPYPEPDETRADLDGEPDPDVHYERHQEAVAAWREAAADAIVETVTLTADGDTYTVEVAVLG